MERGLRLIRYARMAKATVQNKIRAFTLAELIVVISILAILGTVGFLALSGYSEDAKYSRIKMNTRSVYAAISTESAISGNSPRYYVVHDPDWALSGAVIAFGPSSQTLTWGEWNQPGTNYSVWNPDFVKLKLNPDKFKLSRIERYPLFSLVDSSLGASAGSTVASVPIVGAVDASGVSVVNAKSPRSFVQVAGIQPARPAFVMGNYPVSITGSAAWLIKDLSSASSTWAILDGASVNSVGYSYDWSPSAWSTCAGETGSWSYSAWSSCSLVCWGGTQTRTSTCTRGNNGNQSRTVVCARSDGTTMPDSYCSWVKPSAAQTCSLWSDSVCWTMSPISQSCNTQNCSQTYSHPTCPGGYCYSNAATALKFCQMQWFNTYSTYSGPWCACDANAMYWNGSSWVGGGVASCPGWCWPSLAMTSVTCAY